MQLPLCEVLHVATAHPTNRKYLAMFRRLDLWCYDQKICPPATNAVQIYSHVSTQPGTAVRNHHEHCSPLRTIVVWVQCKQILMFENVVFWSVRWQRVYKSRVLSEGEKNTLNSKGALNLL